jgi:hypothetical protein
MKKLMQVCGGIFIVLGLRSLLNSDPKGFIMLTSLGISFLIGPSRSKAARKIRWAFIFIAFVFLIISITARLLA